jgi:hypothetical protein
MRLKDQTLTGVFLQERGLYTQSYDQMVKGFRRLLRGSQVLTAMARLYVSKGHLDLST